ncbi:MAG: hypothetical protein ACLSA2_08580 [Candidatus Gastranaerophilaceae bacterium]
MNKNFAMSALGYVIILVIILGIVMIISAPMMADKYKKNGNLSKNNNSKSEYQDENYKDDRDRDYYNESVSDDYASKDDLMQLENNFSRKFFEMESNISRISNSASSTGVSDKYVCSIEGYLDSSGSVREIGEDTSIDIRNQKIVFVCEYRR